MGNIVITDQTRCYDEKGSIIPCAGTGQDGALPVLHSWPEPRFSIQDDLVFDKLTNLVWAKNANLNGFPLTWEDSTAFINEMNERKIFGHSDWKLPSRRELFSLVSHVEINPALPKGHPFVKVFTGYYWSSTEVARYPKQAWYIHFGGGRVFKGMKHGSYMVWPVRKGLRNEDEDGTWQEDIIQSELRFVDKGETVVDRSSGLEWTKDANPATKEFDWKSALGAIEIINEEKMYGHSDWRLPNIREIECLIYTEAHSPALLPEHPFKKVQKYYWSSTTSTYEPTYAWVLYMEDGAVGVGFKESADFFVWPVRSSKIETIC
jgi:hypothetical protein